MDDKKRNEKTTNARDGPRLWIWTREEPGRGSWGSSFLQTLKSDWFVFTELKGTKTSLHSLLQRAKELFSLRQVTSAGRPDRPAVTGQTSDQVQLDERVCLSVCVCAELQRGEGVQVNKVGG